MEVMPIAIAPESRADDVSLSDPPEVEAPGIVTPQELAPHADEPMQEVLPRRDTLSSLVETMARDSAAKNQQLNRLLDALAQAITHGRESYEREIKTLRGQLDHLRMEREQDRASFDARVNANLEDVRAERDHLRSRVRELELARDSLTQVLMTERRRGLFVWLFKR